MKKTIVCISGTSRPNNYTSLAVKVVEEDLRSNGVTVVVFDGRELDLSFPGQPSTPDANEVRAAIADAEGVVLATPEYHGSFSALTKREQSRSQAYARPSMTRVDARMPTPRRCFRSSPSRS